jgi:hypothetical protein
MNKLIDKLPKRFSWTIHNLIGHPLMEICYLIGLDSLGDKIHDGTVPKRLYFSDEYLEAQKTNKQ